MTFTITVDIKQSVKDFYPGLSNDEIELIATHIVKRWDYSSIYSTIEEQIKETAQYANIELEGKDGIIESEKKELLGQADGAFYYKYGDKVVKLFEPHIDPYGGH